MSEAIFWFVCYFFGMAYLGYRLADSDLADKIALELKVAWCWLMHFLSFGKESYTVTVYKGDKAVREIHIGEQDD